MRMGKGNCDGKFEEKKKLFNSTLYRASLCFILLANYEYVSIGRMLTEMHV